VVVPADSTDTVRAQLRAPGDTAIALVTATCLGTTRTLTVAYRRAPPTLIEVVPAAATVAAGAGNSLSVTVQLLRRFGAPSPGWSITLAATDPLDTVRGRFSANNVFASSNSVTVAYTSPDSTYLGPVVLTATANGVSGSATILVTHAK
jgi:hypothetical protein